MSADPTIHPAITLPVAPTAFPNLLALDVQDKTVSNPKLTSTTRLLLVAAEMTLILKEAEVDTPIGTDM
jgi:hypothetical protein